MTNIRIITAKNTLQEFWNKFKEKAVVNLKDIDKLQQAMEMVWNRIDELEKSRENWKSKYYELKEKIKQ